MISGIAAARRPTRRRAFGAQRTRRRTFLAARGVALFGSHRDALAMDMPLMRDKTMQAKLLSDPTLGRNTN
jgi:hypothetical protein